jgi:tetratricopeptide (TPR) repeat protein
MQEQHSNTEEILSELERNIKDFDKASIEEICQSVLAGEPENAKAHKMLFEMALSSGDLEEAEKHAITWITAADGFIPRFYLASMLSKAGRDHDAIEQFQFALRDSTGEEVELFDAFKAMGNSYVRTLDYQSAEELYNRAYALNPNSDILEVNYGTLFIQMNRFIEAAERFKNAVALNPANEKAWIGLALSYRGLRENDLAFANIQKALELDAKSSIATQLLFDWAFQDNQFELLTRTLEAKLKSDAAQLKDAIILAKVFAYQAYWVPATELLQGFINKYSDGNTEEHATEIAEAQTLLEFCKSKLSNV